MIGKDIYRVESPKPKVILLDWDNTLIDSTEYFSTVDRNIFRRIKQDYGVEPSKPLETLPEESDLAFFSRILASSELGEKAVYLFEEYTRGGGMPVIFMPGARELLRFLDAENIPHAIMSNSEDSYLREFVNVSCDREGLATPTTVGISGADVLKKPHPSGIFKALNLLSSGSDSHLPDRQVWMIGDSPDSDGMASINAGISAIIVPYKVDQQVDQAQWDVLPNLLALKNRIETAL